MSLNKAQITWGQYPTSCNWWCRRKHDILDVVEFLASNYSGDGSATILGIAEGLNSSFGNGKVLPIDLSPAEEVLTDKWSKEQFAPYLINLVQKIEYLKQNPTYAINDMYLISLLLGEICLVNHYYTNVLNETLSPQANDALSAYVYKCLNPLKTELIKLLPANAQKYTVKYDFIDLPKPLVNSGMLTSTKFICEIYAPKGISVLGSEDIPDSIALTESYIYFDNDVIQSNPNSQSNNSGSSNPVSTAPSQASELEPKPQPQTQTQTEPNTTSSNKKSLLGWIIGGIVIYRIFK